MLYGGTLHTVIGYYLHPVIDTRIVCDTYYIFSGCHVQYFYLRKKNQNDVFCFRKEFLAPHWIPILPEDFPLQPAGDGGGSWT
jgi:hypothetical protein